MKKCRRRKCLCCDELFQPDRRNLRHQSYCSNPACRRASKAASQAKWRAGPKGLDYFRGPENVARVQQWRKDHPGYSTSKTSAAPEPLQDHCSSQTIDNHQVTTNLLQQALQDDCFSQPAFIVGLMSSLTGEALQENIVGFIRSTHARGQHILGMVPRMVSEGPHSHDPQTPHRPTSAASNTQAV